MFPEIWNCPYSNDSFPVYCEPIPELGENQNPSGTDNPSFQMMQTAARKHGIYFVGGSIPETHNGKLYNTCCVFDRSGTLIAKHRSVALYQLEFLALVLGRCICLILTSLGRSRSENLTF